MRISKNEAVWRFIRCLHLTRYEPPGSHNGRFPVAREFGPSLTGQINALQGDRTLLALSAPADIHDAAMLVERRVESFSFAEPLGAFPRCSSICRRILTHSERDASFFIPLLAS